MSCFDLSAERSSAACLPAPEPAVARAAQAPVMAPVGASHGLSCGRPVAGGGGIPASATPGGGAARPRSRDVKTGRYLPFANPRPRRDPQVDREGLPRAPGRSLCTRAGRDYRARVLCLLRRHAVAPRPVPEPLRLVIRDLALVELEAEALLVDLARARAAGDGAYRAWRADSAAIERGRRPKPAKLAVDSRLCREVERGLRANWSPQQIAARLICDYPDDLSMRVSHETIYRTLFIQARGALRKELTVCLRTGRAQRRPHMRIEQSAPGGCGT